MKEIKTPWVGYKHFLLEDVEYTRDYYLYVTLMIERGDNQERKGKILIHRADPEKYYSRFEEYIKDREIITVFEGRLPEELHKDFLHMLFLEQKETRL